ncbi:hypothetical protein [Calothrix sp. PCC 6303]|uniref:hypothetical protein n=1 Tax=Calothrix sp. PCC 6303 TaxID=1170562 RepID=UPI0006878C30|nr:hypothetical protein [Calothrix sp. PCC 6303]
MKFILVIIGFTLVLSLNNRSIQAQSLPSINIPSDVTPNSNEPLSSPTVMPSDAPSIEKEKPLRRYIGISGTIGVNGVGKGLSHGGITIFQKNDLSDSFSIRGSNIFGGDKNDSTFALTANFPVKTSSGQVKFVPFIGGGMLVRAKSNFEDINVRGLVTGGIDIPLSRSFTATTAVNVGLFQQTEVGVQLGIGYNF